MKNTANCVIQQNVPLANFTSFKIGGKARFFVEANHRNIAEILNWARGQNLPFCILGGGSNVLIPSAGLDGLLIRFAPQNAEVYIEDGKILASANLPLAKLVNFAEKNGISDFEFLAGIPGTAGGAVFMNAGTSGVLKREISDVFYSANLIDFSGNLKERTKDEMNFSYRKSAVQTENEIILSAKFLIETRASPAEIKKSVKEILAQRKIREPKNHKNAGSIFKAIEGTPAAIYIDKAGLKGAKCGDAIISLKHANWIENLGNASSDDVLNLIEFVRQKVYEKFAVNLETEIKILELKKF